MLYKQLATSLSKRTKKQSLCYVDGATPTGGGVEVALSAELQEDGGYFFAALWVRVG